MKKFTMLLPFLCLVFLTYAQNREEGNVQKAIEAKLDASKNRNFEAMKAAWKHDANASNTFISRNGYSTVKSWDSIAKTIGPAAQQNQGTSVPQVKLDNFVIHVNGDVAFADFDRVVTPSTDQSTIFPYTGTTRYHDYEMLVKENGQWKTHTRITTVPESYTGSPNNLAEADLNTSGYNLIAANRMDDAIEVFKLNVKLYPNSWNTYDSLGEAYALAGNKKMAIKNYEKSVKLNPKSELGPQILIKLKQK